MAISKEVVQELLKEYKNPEDLLGSEGILKQLQKELLEAALGSELSEYLGYEKNQPGSKETANRWNGFSSKTVRSDAGELELDIPRDRDASFEPKLIGKHQREIRGLAIRFCRCMLEG
jgi:transposase-like protein